MAKAAQKRNILFDRFSTHLSKLKRDGKLVDINLKSDDTYICPICLNQFSKSNLKIDSDNMLTLEDSPPDSLGGKKVALTCKACNSMCGHNLDFHLQEGILELDSKEFLPNSTQKANITIDGVTVTGELKVTEDSIEVFVSEKNNNPVLTKEHIKKAIPDNEASVKPKPSRVVPLKFEVALLKSAYILAFAKFGYNLFLNQCYDIVREQIKNPNKQIYPKGFWMALPFNEELEGVHFILNEGFQSILVILPIKTKSSTRRFGVVLPLPNVPIVDVVAEFKKQEVGFSLTLDPMGGKEIDYLTNKEAIEKMHNWINNLGINS
jgi:hypothetical protein